MTGASTDPHERARDMLDCLRESRPAANGPELGLADAYAAVAAMRAMRIAAGERHVGRKIGFTNRTIWPEYGVYAPIWGDMYDSTVAKIPADGVVPLAGMMEPRIEPEIAFGLARAPAPGMDERELAGCIAWLAHAFEIVQSPYPGWKFTAAQGVLAGGLHGALHLGPRAPLTPDQDWAARLRDFSVELFRNGALVDTGHGRNVLESPLLALGHLVELLAQDPHNPPLAPGEIVTTGTLTRAFPVQPGERWTTRITGLPLEGLAVVFR